MDWLIWLLLALLYLGFVAYRAIWRRIAKKPLELEEGEIRMISNRLVGTYSDSERVAALKEMGLSGFEALSNDSLIALDALMFQCASCGRWGRKGQEHGNFIGDICGECHTGEEHVNDVGC